MNQRRSFLRDAALIIAASILPKILQPIASEIEDENAALMKKYGIESFKIDGYVFDYTRHEPFNNAASKLICFNCSVGEPKRVTIKIKSSN